MKWLLLTVVYIFMAYGVSYPAVAAPASHSSYQDIAFQDALAAGIPPLLFVKQIYQESGFNPTAVSPAGAVGIAQFMPATAAELGINPYDPVASLKGATQLMGRYYRTYGNYAKALAGYNCGGGCLRSANTYGASWGCYIPVATVDYIYAIMGVYVC